ncbi:hypothetical protein ACSAZL_12860 [Methanosarcina sp. T3]|uniref:hypothetical protein n=1 Tax=Methanosarcina sp. T3 TaxID=3439062 RepID=UPI003F875A20
MKFFGSTERKTGQRRLPTWKKIPGKLDPVFLSTKISRYLQTERINFNFCVIITLLLAGGTIMEHELEEVERDYIEFRKEMGEN